MESLFNLAASYWFPLELANTLEGKSDPSGWTSLSKPQSLLHSDSLLFSDSIKQMFLIPCSASIIVLSYMSELLSLLLEQKQLLPFT